MAIIFKKGKKLNIYIYIYNKFTPPFCNRSISLKLVVLNNIRHTQEDRLGKKEERKLVLTAAHWLYAIVTFAVRIIELRIFLTTEEKA